MREVRLKLEIYTLKKIKGISLKEPKCAVENKEL